MESNSSPLFEVVKDNSRRFYVFGLPNVNGLVMVVNTTCVDALCMPKDVVQ